MGIQITVRLDKREREYIDRLIDRGLFASYGHCLRGLLYWHKVYERELGRLKSDCAALRERCRLYESGELKASPQTRLARFQPGTTKTG